MPVVEVGRVRSRRLEQATGRPGWCVMGIETLNNAAHAAGFAMAAPEEPFEDFSAEIGSSTAQRQPSRAILAQGALGDRADWVSLFLGLFGRRPPARRPALTAEA